MTPTTEEKLLTDVGFIRAQTEAQTAMLQVHTEKLDSIDYTLNGNGVPGLKATVQAHEKTLSNLNRAAWIIGTPVLTAAGTGVLALIYWACTHH
jgi:hypothetical protein